MAFYNQKSGVVSYDMELIEKQPEIDGVKSKELAKKFITYFNSVLEDIIKENLFEKFEEWCDESEEMVKHREEEEEEDEMCDEGCGTTLTEDTPIMCWVSKDKEEKTVCRTCYDDCGYKETDTNSDNKPE